MTVQTGMDGNKVSFFPKIVQILAVFFCSVAFSATAFAAGVFAPDACDPDYYQSMKSRAWLEAQREITQNQNLIFKPDSVLEYTCFDKFLGVLAANSKDMFSESTRWGPAAGDMKKALDALIAPPMSAYEAANFDHTGLGGRMSVGYTLPGSVTPDPTYTCANMKAVWMAAKCMNFIDNAAEDGFFTFAEYAADPDKRFLPDRCPGTADYQSNFEKALIDSKTPWSEDPLVTRLKYIYPKATGAGASPCGGPKSKIETGLVVEQSLGGVTKYKEHVCLVPGCHYKPINMSLGTCVKN